MNNFASSRGTWDQSPLWQRHCGFLRLRLPEFMEIQRHLLMEELRLLSPSKIGARFFPDRPLETVEEFRRSVPLTTFRDYAPFLNPEQEELLPVKPYLWTHTAASGSAYKLVPYTERAYEQLLDTIMTLFILATASREGDVTDLSEARVLFNLPPRPYLSGHVIYGMAERFGLRSVAPLEEQDGLGFQEKTKRQFDRALDTGVDLAISMTSVLVKMSQAFQRRSGGSGLRSLLRRPKALARLARAYLYAKARRQPLLPKHVWPVKALLSWGSDTHLYRDYLRQAWGQAPFEFYATTEVGIVAVQSWERGGMVLVPYSGFYEFIPEEEWRRSRGDPEYQPRTVLLDEVEAGRRYEVVVTSFYGMPFLRYRLGHLVDVVATTESGSGTEIPQIGFHERSDEIIDILGFTKINEQSMELALNLAGVDADRWTLRKELDTGSPVLRLYIETRDGHLTGEPLEEAIHAAPRKVDPFFKDLEDMLEVRPLRVTLLPQGSFQAYADVQRRANQPPARWTPLRVNSTDEELALLLTAHAGEGVERVSIPVA